MSNRGEDEVVWCLSEADGKVLWATRLAAACQEGGPQGKKGPACTPTVDGERLFVFGAGGDVACLKTRDGEIVWRRSLVDDFGGRLPQWRFTESPLVDGNQVICTPGGEDATLVTLDKFTGSTIWKSRMPDDSSGDSGSSGEIAAAPRGRGAAPVGRTAAPRDGGARPGVASATAVTGTKDPGLFASEHWGMRAFSCKIPNGKYRVKLYFAETFAGVTGPGQRVFYLNVQGHEIKDFDIWAKAGGPRRAYIETVYAEVTNGEFRIVFTPKVEDPAINAIEIAPQTETDEGAASPEATIRIKAGRSTPFTDSSGRVWKADEGFEGGSFGGMAVMSGGFDRGRGGFGGLPKHTARTLRKDLAAAGAAWIAVAKDDPAEHARRKESDFLKYRASAGRVADFHETRHTHISAIVSGGASVKTAQELARHATPVLTIGRYSHARLRDLTGTLETLVDLQPQDESDDSQRQARQSEEP